MVDIGVPPGIDSLLGGGGDDGDAGSWEDRLIEAAYTSPGGTRLRFKYEDLSRSTELRGTAYEFPGVDGAFVQRRGFGPRLYPMRCFFDGPDHDRIATAFETLILEDGRGMLEHPTYGEIPDVVPFGTLGRRDDLKTAANQSVVEVTFWTTLVEVYPSSQKSPTNEILDSLGEFNAAAAQEFADSLDVSDAVAQANASATVLDMLNDVSAALSAVASTTADVKAVFDAGFAAINFGIDVLIGQPLLLAQQISNLIQAPARALAGITSRLEAYNALAESIFGKSAARPEDQPPTSSAIELRTRSNDARISDLFVMSAVSGSVLSTVENRFSTKPDALGAADAVLRQFDNVVQWRDAAIQQVGGVDVGGAYQALQESAALTAGFLVQISFSLVVERQIVTVRERTIIDLAAELYGEVDARLDLLIASNDLSGSEILELPRGTLIRYYP